MPCELGAQCNYRGMALTRRQHRATHFLSSERQICFRHIYLRFMKLESKKDGILTLSPWYCAIYSEEAPTHLDPFRKFFILTILL